MDSNDNCTPESRFMRAVILMMTCTPEILNFILKSPRLRLLPVLSCVNLALYSQNARVCGCLCVRACVRACVCVCACVCMRLE